MKVPSKTYLLILVIIGTYFSSCNSNTSSNNNNISTATFKVKTQTNNNGYTDTLHYDTLGRLSSLTGINGSITYVYTTNTVKEILTNPPVTTTYTLNSQGQAISDDHGHIYTYDANGYLVFDTSNGYSIHYTINQGNIITKNTGIVYDFTFGTQPESRIYGKNFLGNRNTSLPTSENISSGNIQHTAFTYTFDMQGRITKELQTNTGTTNSTYQWTYTYY